MRALTLTQPWAGLVAAGIKQVENRPRKMIKREDFGKPFAIHASREIDEDVYARIYDLAPELDGTFGIEPWSKLSRLTSAVIAVATLVGEVDPGEPFPPDQRRWFFGPIGYVLRDVCALAKPVPCRGWQGFWTLPADVERDVLAQFKEAA